VSNNMAAEKPRLTVYDCQTQAAENATLAATITDADLYVDTDADATKLNKFDTRVQPWKEDCEFKYHRYHFVVAESKKVQGWMLVDIRTHNPKPGRTWTYVYLDKVSVRNGTRGVGKQLGDYLKTWAATLEPKIDFIWLWAIDEKVSNIYEERWDYERVQYYDGYGFMFYTINRSPPLSMLQSVLPEHPRVYWVAADMVAKMHPRNDELIELITKKRKEAPDKPPKEILEPFIDTLKDLTPEEVKDVQRELLTALRRTAGRRRKTRRFKQPRLMSRKYCKKTPCRRMGFTQRASCRPYKTCYTRRR